MLAEPQVWLVRSIKSLAILINGR